MNWRAALLITTVLLASCASTDEGTSSPTDPNDDPSRPVATADPLDGDGVTSVETGGVDAADDAPDYAGDGAPDAAALIAGGLDRSAGGYHFTTTATVDGAVVLTAEGDRIGDGVRLSAMSGGATVGYVFTANGTWVFANDAWSELDEPAPVSDPLGSLRVPLDAIVTSFGDGPTVVAARYPASALSLTGDSPIDVIFTFDGDTLTSMVYTAPSDGVPAEVRADFSDLVDATPITVPIP